MLKAGLFITNVISTTFNIILYKNQNYLHLKQISSCLDVIVIVPILFWVIVLFRKFISLKRNKEQFLCLI